MEIFTGAASSALSEINKWLWNIAASKISYILCYDRKVEELKHLVQELDIKKTDIQQEVDAAKRNGRTIHEDVSQWLKNSNDVKEDARRLEDQVKGVRRFMGCCWDCISSYKIGKKVAEKIAIVNKLLSTNFTSFSHDPSPPSIELLYPNRDFQESLSTKSSMDHIWEALNNEKNYIIGVYGMGGVGKTTIMKEVAKRAKYEGAYNEVIMVTVSQNQDVKRMQTEIAEQLGLQLTTESEIVRGGKILTRIKGASKMLIILDDLWDFLDTSKIGIPSADENKECKVVITTRSIDVCSIMKCQKHIKVEPLSEKESWDLFKLEVGDVLEKPDLREIALDVAKECSGLPLAIITLGRAMRNKDHISTWISVRTELRQSIQTDIKGMEDSVFKCIRRSFDYLRSDEAKLCFLLCSLFPEDWEIDIIEFFRYVVGEQILQHDYSMEEAWNRVCRLLDELKDCCLLLEGKDSEHFKMHDVVRDVAIWISSDKTYGSFSFTNKELRRWPRIGQVDECQRISIMGNSFDSLPEEVIFPKLRTLILKETRILTIPDRFFQRMEALLVLNLGTNVLPSSFSCLVNLKALFLSGEVNFDVTSLSLIGKLKNLQILQLEGFEFGTVPKEFGNLTSLRCLDLLHCKGTIPPNLISRLSRLEQLYLPDVFSNWQVVEGSSSGDTGCATFAELASLSCLTTLHVEIENPDIFLQQDLNFGPWQLALTDFRIVVGNPDILYLPVSFVRRRSRSKQLVITKSKYKWVTDLVTKTEWLCLHNWSGMECLISADEEGYTVGHKLFEVKELVLHCMPDTKSLCTGMLPNDIILRKLIALEIRSCRKLIDVLPTSMLLRTHQLMERLEISSCRKLEKVLSLNFVRQQGGGQSAGTGIVLLPRLESIYLRNLPELRSIWGDDGLIMLPGSLQKLQILHVARCKRLTDHILPPMLSIPSLRTLEIRGCDSLPYLLTWRQAKGLPHLEILRVSSCERMETVIKAATDHDDDNSLASAVQLLPRLERIRLYHLPELRSVWEDDDGVIMLPGSLQNLRRVYVARCKSLKDHILPPVLPIPRLRSLDIRGCDSLAYLLSWRQAKGLAYLHNLHVWNCESMETIIKEEEEEEEEGAADDDIYHNIEEEEEESDVLASLTELYLVNLPMLRSFQGGEQCSKSVLSSFKSLKNLRVVECPKLKKLPLSSSLVLEYLRGDSWEWFETFEWGEGESIKDRLRAVFQPWECDDRIIQDNI